MIRYRKVQNKNAKSTTYGKWYGRAVMTETTTLDTLAERIQRNCTAKKADVKAVLEELSEVMRDELLSSHRVKIDGLGAFKVSLSTKAAESKDDFTANNVTRVSVIFQPESKRTSASGLTRTLVSGAQIGELTSVSLSDSTKADSTKTDDQTND